MRKQVIFLWRGLLFGLLWIAASLPVMAADAVTVELDGTENYQMAYEVLELVNEERAKAGSGPLVMDKKLQGSAMLRSHEQPVFFSHTRPDGSHWSDTIENAGTRAGENIAAGQASAAAVMNSWMNSDGHRANILNSDFTTIGIGCFRHNGMYYWVQLFTNKTVETTTQIHQREVTASVCVSQENLELSLIPDKKGSIKEGESLEVEVRNVNKQWDYAVAVLNANSFTWSTGNALSASVANGTVTGVGAGTAIITAKAGETSTSMEVKVEHDWNNTYQVITAPTCTAEGSEGILCNHCGVEDASKRRSIDQKPHEYSSTYNIITPPTCTQEGVEAADCNNCTARHERIVAATGHNHGEYEVKQPATCTTKGIETSSCDECGTELTQEIPLKNHQYSGYQTKQPATCTAAGLEVRSCSGCGHEQMRNIAAKGHRYGAWAVTRQSTCLDEGVKSRGCSGCKAVQTQRMPKLRAAVTLNASSLKLQIKKSTMALKIKSQTDGDAVSKWRSSNTTVVSVHARSGKITARKTGTAYVILEMKSGASARCKIRVQKGVVKTVSLKTNKKTITLKKGKTAQLKITVNPITSSEKVTYKTENKKIATVSKKGKVKARKKGQTRIVVKSGKKTLRIKIKVK